MFLKTDEFAYNQKTVMLTEMSALQRIEYLEYSVELSKPQVEPESDIAKVAALSRQNLNLNARLVALSLWHSDNKKTVKDIQQTILSTWPSEALSLAANQVLILSKMVPELPDAADPVIENGETSEVVDNSAEKS
ncbi:phage minor tail protein G [Buttiauxella sp. A2-C1_F]|uniref:phage tail assembly chaperone G n=1 Tax=Buttiauxella sp. A2-C1_F TaxID=2904526 RepID=UPI001E5A69EC|nr:phage minor tail protein G [Buttiauxella sp. A2-C1_F]MCE0846031.1 phage minor tail protein G [Buttiauxella sp. A2-C1_F]